MGEEVLEGSGSLAGRGERGRGLPLGSGQRWGQSVIAWGLWVPTPFPCGMLPDAAPETPGVSAPQLGGDGWWGGPAKGPLETNPNRVPQRARVGGRLCVGGLRAGVTCDGRGLTRPCNQG